MRRLLTERAALYKKIRQYFDNAGVTEVVTPALSFAGNTDAAIESFVCHSDSYSAPLYLHTSPEFFMKRLLVEGSGSIYQICNVFRSEEQGRYHNPEFAMLEWYRLDYDYRQLMQDVEHLLNTLLDDNQQTPVVYRSYAQLFESFSVNPFTADIEQLKAVVFANAIDVHKPETLNRQQWLDLMMVELIEPAMQFNAMTFVYDYPADQASLAKLRNDAGVMVAERFELYWQGMELANGFTELTDADEQQRRFEKDLLKRQANGQSRIKPDDKFITALRKGMPACSGVALGIERLLMILLKQERLNQVMPFGFDQV